MASSPIWSRLSGFAISTLKAGARAAAREAQIELRKACGEIGPARQRQRMIAGAAAQRDAGRQHCPQPPIPVHRPDTSSGREEGGNKIGAKLRVVTTIGFLV
jgi:hypothetical protein